MTGLLPRRMLLAGVVLMCALLAPERLRACSQREPAAPNGYLIRQPLATCEKKLMLAPGGRPALYALRGPFGFQKQREPVVLVHGLSGHPAELADLAERLSAAGYQVYVVFFDDMGRTTRQNGAGLAVEIMKLAAKQLGAGRDLTLIAHSAGGLITRLALNLLADCGKLARFRQVHFYAIDTPWHGYRGPSDASWSGRLHMDMVRPLLPDGLEDLRAESVLFIGDPYSPITPLRTGLLHYPLPANVHVHLYFAQEGGEVLDYTEGLLAQLSARLAAYYGSNQPLPADPRLRNFWHALISADSYFTFQEELRELADRGRLDAATVRRALLRHFPRFPGDHSGVLHAPRRGSGPQLFALLLQSLAGQRTAGLAAEAATAHPHVNVNVNVNLNMNMHVNEHMSVHTNKEPRIMAELRGRPPRATVTATLAATVAATRAATLTATKM